jgi:hypothetical protein
MSEKLYIAEGSLPEAALQPEKAQGWRTTFASRLRQRAIDAIHMGVAFGTVTALISVAGILHYCSRCGQWQGPGPEPGSQSPPPQAPEIPPALKETARLPQEAARPKWQEGAYINEQPAKFRESGRGFEALWGGVDRRGDGDNHGHLYTADGLNANLVAEPGSNKQDRDTPVDDWRADPYDQTQLPDIANCQHDEDDGTYRFS